MSTKANSLVVVLLLAGTWINCGNTAVAAQNPSSNTKIEVKDTPSAAKAVFEERGFINGRVTDKEGRAIVGAEVALCTSKNEVKISNGKLTRTRLRDVDSEIVITDSKGVFSFKSPAPDEFHILATCEKGFAWSRAEDGAVSTEIKVQPWGRIEGKLLIGRDLGRGKQVGLISYTDHNMATRFYADDKDTTNKQGQFTIERVPPGLVEIGYMVLTGRHFFGYTNRTLVKVRPGQTLEMTLGGTGRPVVGRFVTPKNYQEQITFDWGLRALVTVRPEIPYPENLTEKERQVWYKSWYKTKAGQVYWESCWLDEKRRHYAFHINEDGTFRIEDVPAGKYQFHVWVEKVSALAEKMSARMEEIAGYGGSLEVPPIPSGRSDESLDLGDLELTMTKSPQTENAAPAKCKR